MSQRLSRRQIKRDEFKESLGSAIHFIRDHLRAIAAVLVAVLVVAVVATAVFGFRQRRAGRANESLARAATVFAAEIDAISPRPSDPVAPTFADRESRDERARELLEALREDYRGSDAADIAAVYLGQLEASTGDLETARRLWEEFLERQSGHMLAAQVRLNLISLDLAEGRAQELAERLQAMLDSSDTGLPADLVLHELIRAREAVGDEAGAREARQRLVEEYPESPYAARARTSFTPTPPGL